MKKITMILLILGAIASGCATTSPVTSIGPPQGEVSGAEGP